MNKEALILFLILLLGLVLCSFLGGSNCTKEGYTNKKTSSTKDNSKSNSTYSSKYPNVSTQTKLHSKKDKYNYEHNYNNNYDNYNHYSGTSTLANGTIFYGPNGNTAEYIVASNGTASIKLIQTGGGSSYIIFNSKSQTGYSSNTSQTDTTFYGPKGFTAKVINGSNGEHILIFTLPNGTTQVFTHNTRINNTEYYGSTGSNMPPSSSYSAYHGAYGGSAGYAKGPYGNSAYYAQGPNGSTVSGTSSGSNSSSNSSSSSSIYGGIPSSQIPPGQEDLYILKSEIVPPVCPACPSSSACPSTSSSKEKCPPCPACARCPEPSFECKKVPNYDAISEENLPQPVLSSFTTFGA